MAFQRFVAQGAGSPNLLKNNGFSNLEGTALGFRGDSVRAKVGLFPADFLSTLFLSSGRTLDFSDACLHNKISGIAVVVAQCKDPVVNGF